MIEYESIEQLIKYIIEYESIDQLIVGLMALYITLSCFYLLAWLGVQFYKDEKRSGQGLKKSIVFFVVYYFQMFTIRKKRQT